MKIFYRFHLDDSTQATERRFVRGPEEWPFPSFPAPGDAVVIDVPGTGGLRSEQQGNVTHTWPEPLEVLEGRISAGRFFLR
jgi:hypothetical protein